MRFRVLSWKLQAGKQSDYTTGTKQLPARQSFSADSHRAALSITADSRFSSSAIFCSEAP